MGAIQRRRGTTKTKWEEERGRREREEKEEEENEKEKEKRERAEREEIRDKREIREDHKYKHYGVHLDAELAVSNIQNNVCVQVGNISRDHLPGHLSGFFRIFLDNISLDFS